MEMTQFSVTAGSNLYKGKDVIEKIKTSDESNARISGSKHFNEEFSKELKNASKNNKKTKTENTSIVPQENTKVKETTKKSDLNSNDDKSEKIVKSSDDIQSLINLIIALLNTNKTDSNETQLNSFNNIEGSQVVDTNFQALIELLGSKDNANNLLNLLNEVSMNNDVKDKLTELLSSINKEFIETGENSDALIKLLTSSEYTEPDDLVNQLQKIVSMNNINKEEDNINIPIQVVKDIDTKDKTNTSPSTGDDESDTKDGKFSKETAILNKVINGEAKESKVARATDFMSFFENNVLESRDVTGEKPIAITKSDLNNDIIKALSYMDKSGVKDLTVKIYPKELGEVTISVSMEQGALKAMIKATSKETVEMLALGLKDINEKLNGNNIKIESVNIGLYEEDTTYFARENAQGKAYDNGGQNGSKNGGRGSDESIDEEEIISQINSQTSNEIDLLV